jgi:CBS domain-containing protein
MTGSSSEHDCDRVVGIMTERDVLTRLVVEQRDPARTLVEEIMTSDVAFCSLETTLDELSSIMREKRIRHMPVCDADGKLQGMVSIGDLNAWHAHGQQEEIHHLHEYIHGRV